MIIVLQSEHVFQDFQKICDFECLKRYFLKRKLCKEK